MTRPFAPPAMVHPGMACFVGIGEIECRRNARSGRR